MLFGFFTPEYEDDKALPYKVFRQVLTPDGHVVSKSDRKYVSQHRSLIQAMDAAHEHLRSKFGPVYIETPDRFWKSNNGKGWLEIK